MIRNIVKPVYTVKIRSSRCGFKLLINGCLEEVIGGEPVNQEYLINQWLKNGTNTIELHQCNIHDESTGKAGILLDAKLSLELRVKEHGTSESILLSTTLFDASKLKRTNVLGGHRVDYDDVPALYTSIEGSSPAQHFNIIDGELIDSESGAFSVGDYELKKGITNALQVTQKVTLPCPFPEWKFFSADTVPYHVTLSDEDWKATRALMIKEAYQPVWDAINNKDIDAMQALFRSRCAEYDQAFYTQEGQNLYELVVHLVGIINDPVWTQLRLDFDDVDLHVAMNEKISWLHTWELPMVSAFKFEHVSANLEKRIPMMFSKFNGQWEIVR